MCKKKLKELGISSTIVDPFPGSCTPGIHEQDLQTSGLKPGCAISGRPPLNITKKNQASRNNARINNCFLLFITNLCFKKIINQRFVYIDCLTREFSFSFLKVKIIVGVRNLGEVVVCRLRLHSQHAGMVRRGKPGRTSCS